MRSEGVWYDAKEMSYLQPSAVYEERSSPAEIEDSGRCLWSMEPLYGYCMVRIFPKASWCRGLYTDAVVVRYKLYVMRSVPHITAGHSNNQPSLFRWVKLFHRHNVSRLLWTKVLLLASLDRGVLRPSAYSSGIPTT